MRIATVVLTLCFALLFIGCSGIAGSGARQTETRTVSSFTRIEMSGAYTVNVTCGAGAPSLTIETDDNLLPFVTTTVNNGTLSVRSTQTLRPSQGIVLTIATPSLSVVDVSGAVSATIKGIAGGDFKLDGSGAGDITLGGATKGFTLRLSGAANVKAVDLRAETVKVTLSGAGSAEVFASRELDAEVSGAGVVRYAGKPSTVRPHVSGVGSVTPL